MSFSDHKIVGFTHKISDLPDQPNMQPENHVMKNLVYSGSRQNVLMTMVNGRILYENQKFSIGVEPEDIYAEVGGIIRRMK